MLERLSPGITRATWRHSPRTNSWPSVSSAEPWTSSTSIKCWKALTARRVAPTARSANSIGPGAFNAHNLSDEEYAKIQRLAHNGTNVRI